MKTILQFSIAFALLLVCGKAQAQTAGTLDTSFNIGTGFDGYATQAIALQPDGKILAVGWFTSYNGQTVNGIARLNPDGTLDTSFTIGTGFNNSVLTIALQPDGKILVGGQFTSFNGTTQNRIARLNTDGTLDTSFNTGTGFSGGVSTIALQSDGKILVGGLFTSYNGQGVNKMVRLNPDGTLETAFTNGAESDQSITKIVVQPDGKILVARSSNQEETLNLIIRLNSDGTPDTSFNLVGTGFGSMSGYSVSMQDAILQPDGKILVIGLFHYYNGQDQKHIARLHPDGSLDTSFAGPSNEIGPWSIALQPDGKILLGGWFYTYNGQTANHIVRLNPEDGTLDTSFSTGTGLNTGSFAFGITLQPDGKILVGGSFTSYNGTSQNRIARLHNDIPAQNQCPEDGFAELYSQAEVNQFIIDYPNCTELEYLLVGSWDDSTDITDLSPLSNLTYVNNLEIVNTQITSLSGLSNLNSEFIYIEEALLLTTFSGLNDNFTGYFSVWGAPLITSLSGLSNLTSVSGLFIAETSITDCSGLNSNLTSLEFMDFQYNANLTSLSGLENLTSVNVVHIAGNDLLTDISALQNIDPETMIGNDDWGYDGLEIYLNPLLEVCNLPNFCTYLQNGGESYIWGNAGDCLNEQAVMNACALSVDDMAFENMKLYPNPVKDILYFDKEIHKITLTDLTGKVLATQSNSSRVDMSGYQSGVYFVIIETENGLKETRKVVKR